MSDPRVDIIASHALGANNPKPLQTMSEFKFSCPHCRQKLKCAGILAGKQIVCPACKHLFAMPAPIARASEVGHTADPRHAGDLSVPTNTQSGMRVAHPEKGAVSLESSET